jgi:hypothetical protein
MIGNAPKKHVNKLVSIYTECKMNLELSICLIIFIANKLFIKMYADL